MSYMWHWNILSAGVFMAAERSSRRVTATTPTASGRTRVGLAARLAQSEGGHHGWNQHQV